MSTSRPSDVDLSICDREPIHLLGRVQPFACLFVVSQDWLVAHASANMDEFVGIEAKETIGRPLFEVLGREAVHTLRTECQFLGHENALGRVFDLRLDGKPNIFNASLHRSGEGYIVEIERATRSEGRDNTYGIQPLAASMSRASTVLELSRIAARGVRAISGYDRVMIYRFAEDGSGEVIAEARSTEVDGFLGLNYPASDIPKQARALYLRSPLRQIADVHADTVAVEPAKDPYGNPPDLSLAVSRSVSPIHIEYLKNMGVAASMSASIIREGRLWGLIACHHNAPRNLDFRTRTAIELYTHFFTHELARIEAAADLARFSDAQQLQDRLMALVVSDSLLDGFEALEEEIGRVLDFDGLSILSKGAYRASGAAPDEGEFEIVQRFLNTTSPTRVYATDNLLGVCPTAKPLSDRVAGMLALPISRQPRDYLVIFRRELVKTVQWAGNPQKPVTSDAVGQRLSPRGSFDLWKETVRERSKPWTRSDIQIAQSLRTTLLEVVLKLTDEAVVERRRSEERQELLIAELNHRVRNILNLIKSLMAQSAGGATDLASFTASLGDRLNALARAHDQLTRTDWKSGRISELIRTEISAFVEVDADRVVFEGPDIEVQSDAFSTMALVFHELVTNAAKYGALTDRHGQVQVATEIDPGGSVSIAWSESGGPEVKDATRRGFGTTIIERSIPFELGGEAAVSLEKSGLTARFKLPERHVTGIRETVEPAAEMKSAFAPYPAGKSEDLAGRRILLVEDNLIIAMDASAHLEAAGAASVVIASNVQDALRRIEEGGVDAAVLDVNLGNSTSAPIAEALAEKGVPFTLATGYAGSDRLLDDFPETTVIRKPYSEEALISAVARLLSE